jgi:hypothetical protein
MFYYTLFLNFENFPIKEQKALSFLIDKMKEYGYEIETQEFNVYEKPFSDIYSTTLWQYFDKYSGDKGSIGKGTNLIAKIANPDNKKIC